MSRRPMSQLCSRFSVGLLRSSATRKFSNANLPGTVNYLRHPHDGKEVFLLGTAHISKKSAEEVVQVLDLVKPDTVFVELCEARASNLLREMSGEQMFASLTKALALPNQQGGGHRFIPQNVFGMVMKFFYDSMKNLGFIPGLEFKVAMAQARSRNLRLVVGDQDQRITMERVQSSFTLPDLMKLLSVGPQTFKDLPPFPFPLAAGPQGLEQFFQSFDVEKLKDREKVRAMVKYMDAVIPRPMNALLHERDRYMADQLLACSGRKILAVVGMAHMDGVERHFLQGMPTTTNTNTSKQ